MDDIFTPAAQRLMDKCCSLVQLRKFEAGASCEDVWSQFEDSGFGDLLLSEENGGAGLGLADVYAVMALCGEYLIPVPLAETILARGLIAAQGGSIPRGSIALGTALDVRGDTAHCRRAFNAANAGWILVEHGDKNCLLSAGEARRTPVGNSLDMAFEWPAATLALHVCGDRADLMDLQACAASAQLAGAMQRVFSLTLDYANNRQQFGRPIGRFQAVQHQLAVMAEQVFAASMAAQIGCRSASLRPQKLQVATAKARTSEAALEVASLSHSIHGAIGFTAEFDLHLYTRRLYGWRQTAGSESYWHDIAGQAVCTHDGELLDLVRRATDF